jgi:hypothetical protein
MSQHPDGSDPDDPRDNGSSEAGREIDEDAAWRAIVEHYGERAQLDDPEPPAPTPPPAPAARGPILEPGWQDARNTDATWHDEGHFVPPTPPPLPPLDPRRKAAWWGLFGAPALMLVAVVFGWQLPGWLMFGLVGAFVGGFGYLVATMPSSRPGDGSGDDGAVV